MTGTRESTRVSWHEAVERAVWVMRERIADPLTLDALARAAILSPYHFNRVFRLVTGIPPGRFLTALRMAEAKQLLLSTSQRVTDVCFAVGFESLGTFTTRFGQLVGVAPQELRRLAERHGARPMASLAETGEDSSEVGLSGWLDVPVGSCCVALVGLFDGAAPQGLPAGCDIVPHTPGKFRVGQVASGSYRALAIGFPQAETVLDAMLLDSQRMLVGALPEPIRLGHDQGQVNVRLRMQIPARIDPPIVLAAPLLAAEARSARLVHR
jgi:AraC-like DNA-binding protein